MESCHIATLADIEKIEKTAAEERMPALNTYQCIEQGTGMNPDAPAISFIPDGAAYDAPRQITHGQLMGKIRQTANMFHDLGIGPEDVVTFVLPNLPETHFVLWGAEAAGIANPINPMLEPDTLRDICIAAGTKVLVTMGPKSGPEIWKKVNQVREEIPGLKCLICVGGQSDSENAIFGYEEKVEQYPGDRLTFDRTIDKDDIASLYHTGGTTGRPKLARRTHLNEVVMAWDLQAATGLMPGETVMVGLPLFHCNGTIVTGLMPFTGGGHVVMLSAAGYRNPSIIENFYSIVAHYRPVFFSAVPTVLSMLLEAPMDGADISSLRYLICGAAPLSVELFNRFEARTGMKILEGYGLTETAVASALNPKDGERKVGSVGLRLPYHQLKTIILDEKGEYIRDAGAEEIGAVAIKGPCVFKGYVEEIHNQGIWLPGNWFNTGDLGRIDADGYLWLTGRRKELIIRGGHNIDPAVIEEVLYQLPDVKAAAALGRPDAHAGEVPVAYVELKEDSDLDAARIMDYARDHIGERAAVPKAIEVIEQIPVTAVGKIFKPALRWQATREIFEKEMLAVKDLAQWVEVHVGEDKRHGTRVDIRVKPAAGTDDRAVMERINEILSPYTLHVKVALAC